MDVNVIGLIAFLVGSLVGGVAGALIFRNNASKLEKEFKELVVAGHLTADQLITKLRNKLDV